MKLWIAKNSDVPVREQIVAQVTLAVTSGDLIVGAKLPSTAEIARRFAVHANTVSNAYRELADDGWIEYRHGSGFYVCDQSPDAGEGIEQFVARFMKTARSRGFSAADLAECVTRFARREAPARVVLLEDDEFYRAILVAELQSALQVGVDGVATTGFSGADGAIAAAMFDEKPKIASDVECLLLKTRSVAGAMSIETRPTESDLIAVLSGWDKFLLLARTFLIAARIDGESLIVRSTLEPGWRKGLDAATLIICDAPTAVHFDGDPRVRTFRLIADDSIDELRQILAGR